MLACGLGSGAEVPHGLRRGQLSSQCGLWCSCPRSPVSGCATLGRKSASASLGLQPMSGDDRASPPPSRGHGLTVKGGQCPALPCVFSLCDLKTANTDVLTRTQTMRWSPDPGPLPHPGHEAWCLWQPSPLCGSCLCPPHCPQQPSIFGCSHAGGRQVPGVLLGSGVQRRKRPGAHGLVGEGDHVVRDRSRSMWPGSDPQLEAGSPAWPVPPPTTTTSLYVCHPPAAAS